MIKAIFHLSDQQLQLLKATNVSTKLECFKALHGSNLALTLQGFALVDSW